MTNKEITQIGWNLWKAAQLLDDNTFASIKPYLDEIQEVVMKESAIVDSGRPVLTVRGETLFLSQEHLDALLKYEQDEAIKEVIKRFMEPEV